MTHLTDLEAKLEAAQASERRIINAAGITDGDWQRIASAREATQQARRVMAEAVAAKRAAESVEAPKAKFDAKYFADLEALEAKLDARYWSDLADRAADRTAERPDFAHRTDVTTQHCVWCHEVITKCDADCLHAGWYHIGRNSHMCDRNRTLDAQPA